jgi:hypothetical protein
MVEDRAGDLSHLNRGDLMADFDMKTWLDEHVVPLLSDTGLKIYHPFWNGVPPKEVLVILLSDPSPQSAWPKAAKHLIEAGFRFDFLREQQAIALEGGIFTAFGGDGAPLFNEEGTASVRLFKRVGAVNLILQVGCRYSDGIVAAAATKAFYGLFEESPLSVCQTYGATFGQA